MKQQLHGNHEKKYLLPGFLIALMGVVAFSAYLGYLKYTDHKLLAETYPYVKDASLRVHNSLTNELESSGMSYKEHFERIGEDLSALNKDLLAIQTRTTPRTQEQISSMTAYVKGGQEVLRAQLRTRQYKFRVMVESYHLDIMNKLAKEEENPYIQKSMEKTVDELLEVTLKTINDTLESERNFVLALQTYKQSLKRTEQLVPAEFLADGDLIDKVAKEITAQADQIEEGLKKRGLLK